MAPRLDRLDGVKHINIYSKGKTVLGRLLSNFAETPFECEDGKFQSVEGYWYWLSTKDDYLKELSGYKAKEYGRLIDAVEWPEEEIFKEKIKKAIRSKIDSHPRIQELLKESKLPFKHYYVYANKIHKVEKCDWMLDEINKIRQELQCSDSN